MEVFPLFASGAQPKEVASITGLPETTVKGRQARILDVFRVKTIYEATQLAKAQGWL